MGRERIAAQLREVTEAGRTVAALGHGTKAGWGRDAAPEHVLDTTGLDELREHNEGDLTAVIEAGVPLAAAQARFAQAGQMLALDPPLDSEGRGTVGGIVATGDSGPLRHRHGAARDLVVGVTVALSDGVLARAGGKVIKNVAGYDLPKLFAGSFGTLGVIVEVCVRLHPLPAATLTARGAGGDPARVAAAAVALAHEQIELQALDVSWAGGEGAVLARAAGAVPRPSTQRAAAVLEAAGLDVDVVEDDDALWQAQRDAQRAPVVVRVSGVQSQLGEVLAAARDLGCDAVGRAALGLTWLRAPADAEIVRELRRRLAPSPCAVLDSREFPRAPLDPWGPVDPALVGLMERVRDRFDPAGTFA